MDNFQKTQHLVVDEINPSNIMELKPIEEVSSQDEARQIAIDWQAWASEQSLSLGELAEYATYFRTLGDQFALGDEFKENGII